MNSLPALKAPEDIARLAAHHAQLDMVSVKCFCSEDYGKYIACFVDTSRRIAPVLAKAMDGDVLGDTTVAFVIAIPPDFSCHKRDENQLVTDGKCLCRRGYSKTICKPAT